MQALLSYDQSPPIAAPFRFFLTAPVFAILAGALLLWGGPDALASRWTPDVLAVTHLITVGFMLQVMLGALIQILPVVAGANLKQPMRLAAAVHVALNVGALVLGSAFLTFDERWFKGAAIILGAGTMLFLVAAFLALRGIPATSASIKGLKHALIGLGVAVGIGVALTTSLGWSLGLPLLPLADIHLVWGFIGWGLVLLAAVAYVVVPMFQITPAYPASFERWFSLTTLAIVGVWTAVEYFELDAARLLLGVGVAAVVAAFAVITLRLQRASKRARFDASQHCWRVAMLSALGACGVWLLAMLLPAVGEWSGWTLLCGVLLLFGGFTTVIVGMLYKIVPFLIWLHLQNAGARGVLAPNMKKIIAERAMDRQVRAHFAACALVLAAACWPTWFVYPAGVGLIVANAWLLRNLWSGVAVYRAHLRKIAAA